MIILVIIIIIIIIENLIVDPFYDSNYLVFGCALSALAHSDYVAICKGQTIHRQHC